jgi:hypothetical protein
MGFRIPRLVGIILALVIMLANIGQENEVDSMSSEVGPWGRYSEKDGSNMD